MPDKKTNKLTIQLPQNGYSLSIDTSSNPEMSATDVRDGILNNLRDEYKVALNIYSERKKRFIESYNDLKMINPLQEWSDLWEIEEISLLEILDFLSLSKAFNCIEENEKILFDYMEAKKDLDVLESIITEYINEIRKLSNI